MVSASDISPSRGENTEELTKETTALVDSGRWKLWDNGKGLERQFRFKTFKATWVCLFASYEYSLVNLAKAPPLDKHAKLEQPSGGLADVHILSLTNRIS
jgi:hypothetical protein